MLSSRPSSRPGPFVGIADVLDDFIEHGATTCIINRLPAPPGGDSIGPRLVFSANGGHMLFAELRDCFALGRRLKDIVVVGSPDQLGEVCLPTRRLLPPPRSILPPPLTAARRASLPNSHTATLPHPRPPPPPPSPPSPLPQYGVGLKRFIATLGRSGLVFSGSVRKGFLNIGLLSTDRWDNEARRPSPAPPRAPPRARRPSL